MKDVKARPVGTDTPSRTGGHRPVSGVADVLRRLAGGAALDAPDDRVAAEFVDFLAAGRRAHPDQAYAERLRSRLWRLHVVSRVSPGTLPH